MVDCWVAGSTWSKEGRWLSDACNDAAHEVNGKPKPESSGQAKKVANWVAPINLVLQKCVKSVLAQLSRSELKNWVELAVKLLPG